MATRRRSASRPRRGGATEGRKDGGRNVVVFLVGPTAVGKTRLAVSLAERIGAEIVSCDSMQVYRRMPLLSQAASREERSRVPHHLVQCVDPAREFSVAIFARRARRAIREIIRRKKVPLFVGGSGLYVKGLIDGLFPSPPADAAFRKRMEAAAKRRGKEYLHARLARIDPEAALKIHPNDLRRVIRSLEVFHATGKTMTALKRETSGIGSDYEVKVFGLMRPRADLYRLIEERVRDLVDAGAVREVKKLRSRPIGTTASSALGYKEIVSYLDGKTALDDAVRLLKRNTRRFAKRQIAWFRPDKRIKWYDLSKERQNAIVSKIAKRVSG